MGSTREEWVLASVNGKNRSYCVFYLLVEVSFSEDRGLEVEGELKFRYDHTLGYHSMGIFYSSTLTLSKHEVFMLPKKLMALKKLLVVIISITMQVWLCFIKEPLAFRNAY